MMFFPAVLINFPVSKVGLIGTYFDQDAGKRTQCLRAGKKVPAGKFFANNPMVHIHGVKITR